MRLIWLPVLSAALTLLGACGDAPGDGDGQEAASAQPPAVAPTHQCVLAIEGMKCDECVKTLTRVLSRCPGVTEVDVDLESGKGTVRGTGMQLSDLTGAVEKAGYTVAEAEGPTGIAEPDSGE